MSPPLRPIAVALVLAGCASDSAGKAETCTAGLDMNGDGICDREAADWSADATLTPGEHRANIYALADDDWLVARENGLRHALGWPVASTRLLLPYAPMVDVFTDPDDAAIRTAMQQVAGFSSEDGLYDHMGLSRYPASEGEPGTPYWTPFPGGYGPGDAMGAVHLDTELGTGLTFGCAVCHVGTLFGTPVVGLSNKRPRPNALFHFARNTLSPLGGDAFADLTGATEGEVEMFLDTVDALQAVGTLEPVALGLDTSLAQVAGSLARRSPDAVASFDAALEASPAPLVLDDLLADSKPMPWWTVRYKTRWLADGSIIEGNPILTNFLWNELGRGADLEELEAWLRSPEGMTIVDELTVAVFASDAPRWTDFFGADTIDEDLAREGQALFADTCAECHGVYEKGWDAEDATDRSAAERLATTRVLYHPTTPRIDVGTDDQRATAMQDLERLNPLALSQWMQTTVDASDVGYVPPPLDGIWARWPYFHDNSAPTLCAVLTPAAERPTFYVQGPADDPDTHFDAACVGYPTGEAIPADWLDDTDAHVDLTDRPPQGHEAMLTGVGPEERAALVAFLKTL